jgi:CMP-N-acetylneuraminic acid synthetase
MSAPVPLRTLGLILARGGSKRLPGKNLKPLHGKPLVAWSIEAALACREIGMTLVSTDSQEIADVARRHGAQVPFLRPEALAQDHSTSADAALHALDWLRDSAMEFDAVMLLEPTSPLRASGDLSGVARRLAERWDEVDAVVTVGKVHLEQPAVMKILGDGDLLSPWLAPDAAARHASDAWFPYGVAYMVKVAALRKWRSFYPPKVAGYTIERWQNYEVDDEFDFICIESIVKHFDGRLP